MQTIGYFNKDVIGSLTEKFIFRHKALLFFVIFGLQLFFYTYKISHNSLWYDECFTVNTANKTIAGIVEVSQSDVNPPLYPIIVHFWIQIFGISEFSVRFLSAIACALAAAFLYLFSLKYLNWQTAVFSALMFFTTNDFFYYAQEARTYSFVLLFVILSNYCYFNLNLQKQKWKGLFYASLLGLINISLFYLHFLSCFSIIAQIIFCPFFIFGKNDKTGTVLFFKDKINLSFIKYYAISWIVFLIFLVPFYKRFLFLVKEGGKKSWIQKPAFQDFKNCAYELFNSKEVYQVYIFSFIIITLLILFRKLRSENFRIKFFIFALVSGPLMLYLNYIVASYSPIFLSRYVLFTFLGFITCYCYLLSGLKIRFEFKLIMLLAISAFSFTKIQIPKVVKQDYKNGVKYLKSVKKDNVFISTDLPDLFAYYYDKNIFNIVDDKEKTNALFKIGILAPYYDIDWPDKIDFSQFKDIYYTESFEYLNDGNKIVMSKLNLKLNFVKKIGKFEGFHITHYENKNYKVK